MFKSSANPEESGILDFERYQNIQLGFTFEYPKDWINDFINGSLLIYPTDTKRVSTPEKVILSPCITMLIGNARTIEDPQKFCNDYPTTQIDHFADYKLLWNRPVRLPHADAALEWSFQFSKGPDLFIAAAVIAVKQKMIFCLDCSCLKAQFDCFNPEFLRIIRSFSIK
jgi:hypothetical protein